jgi:uncharacterized protein (DUF934 family)
MPTLIDRAGLVQERWTRLQPQAAGVTGATVSTAAGGGARLILSLDQWTSHGEALLASGCVVGIELEPAEGPEAIAHLLDRIQLVAVNFPSFTDGRGYSTARLLRQRHGWTGELRATGDVLCDQMFYLARCGFDTFDLKDGESVEAAVAAFGDFTETYQEAADRGPLFRRRPQPTGSAMPSGAR